MICARYEDEAALAYVVDDGPGKPMRAALCVYARRGSTREKAIAATFGFKRERPPVEKHVAGAAELMLAEQVAYLEEHREVIEALR